MKSYGDFIVPEDEIEPTYEEWLKLLLDQQRRVIAALILDYQIVPGHVARYSWRIDIFPDRKAAESTPIDFGVAKPFDKVPVPQPLQPKE